MKKGLLTLMVALLTLVGMVSYGAVPEMLSIPDVMIGDTEDLAVTPDWFVWDNAFDLDDYWGIASTGTFTGIKWFYNDATPSGVIAINLKLDTDNADVYAINPIVSFRNMLCSPGGGPNTHHPVGTSSPVVVHMTLANTYNVNAKSDGTFTVYTIFGGDDGFSGEWLTTSCFQRTLAVVPTPAWTLVGYTIPIGPDAQFGLRPAVGYHSTTYGAYVLETTGFDNDFGFWCMFDQTPAGLTTTLVPYVSGAGYVVKTNLFAVPTVTTIPNVDPTPPKNDFVPWMRIRMNAANETVSQEMDILSTANGTLEVTTDHANATTEVMVFDPRDQTVVAGLNKLYFSFDLIDFAARDRDYTGQRDEEGRVGIVALSIDTFPLSAFNSVPAGRVKEKSYPVGASFEADAAKYLTFATGFGGTPVTVGFDGGKIKVASTSNVVRGFGYSQLNYAPDAVTTTVGRWYMYKFFATVTGVDPTWMRLRVLYGDNQRQVNYGVRSTGDWNTYQFGSGEFNVFMVPKAGETTPLYFAFDYIDFDATHGAATLLLNKVDVYSVVPPLPMP